MTASLIHPGYGHNSGDDPDVTQEIVRLRTENTELRAQLAVVARQRDSLQGKKDRSDMVIASDMPAPYKLISVRIINATDDDGVGHVKRKLLAQAASVKSLEYISRVVRELKAHGVVQQVEPNSPLYRVPSLVDLQMAVDAYAAGVGRGGVDPSVQGCTTGHPPCTVEHPPCTTGHPQTRAPQVTPRALQVTKGALQDTVRAGSQKGSPPLFPPLSPTPPIPPLYPPHSQNHRPTESSESVDGSVDARKVRAPTNERGTRLPDDWQPDAPLLAWVAVETRLPAERVRVETEKFRDHFHASSGANARKRKWGHAWRNWMRTASDSFVRDQQRQARFSGQPVPMAAKPASTVWWKIEARLAEMTPDRWRKGIAEHAADKWSVPILGPPPGNHSCVVPKDLIAELKLTDIFDEHGFKRETRR